MACRNQDMKKDYHQKNDKKQAQNDTPLSTKILMAVVGVILLVGFYVFFGETRFPVDITFKNVGTSSSYIITRENPYHADPG